MVNVLFLGGYGKFEDIIKVKTIISNLYCLIKWGLYPTCLHIFAPELRSDLRETRKSKVIEEAVWFAGSMYYLFTDYFLRLSTVSLLKMTKKTDQQIGIKFCFKLGDLCENYDAETLGTSVWAKHNLKSSTSSLKMVAHMFTVIPVLADLRRQPQRIISSLSN